MLFSVVVYGAITLMFAVLLIFTQIPGELLVLAAALAFLTGYAVVHLRNRR